MFQSILLAIKPKALLLEFSYLLSFHTSFIIYCKGISILYYFTILLYHKILFMTTFVEKN